MPNWWNIWYTSGYFSNNRELGKTHKNNDPKSVYTTGDYGVTMNWKQACRIKEKALEISRRHSSSSYGKLPNYLHMLEITNPGYVAKLHKSEDWCFMILFVELYARIKGWKYFWHILVVDGTFLKASHWETLITTCTQDASCKYRSSIK